MVNPRPLAYGSVSVPNSGQLQAPGHGPNVEPAGGQGKAVSLIQHQWAQLLGLMLTLMPPSREREAQSLDPEKKVLFSTAETSWPATTFALRPVQ